MEPVFKQVTSIIWESIDFGGNLAELVFDDGTTLAITSAILGIAELDQDKLWGETVELTPVVNAEIRTNIAQELENVGAIRIAA